MYLWGTQENDISCVQAIALILKLRKQPFWVFTLDSCRWIYVSNYRQIIQPVNTRYLKILSDTYCYYPFWSNPKEGPRRRGCKKEMHNIDEAE